MENIPEWLPPLVLLEKHQGNWEKYLNAVYQFFVRDFVDHKPVFRETSLSLKRHPMHDGKEATFWHIISEGEAENERTPDIRRCERIRWPKPIIEYSSEPCIKIWENERKGEKRILLWFESQDYLVVLADRKSYILFWTAYPVTQNHTKRKLQQEYERFKKAKAA
ncbi:MAG: hypothetical protein H6636_04945 [Anaerolineales bacterium]|nr:hypothetical protein [Anaerolineales bacterium]